MASPGNPPTGYIREILHRGRKFDYEQVAWTGPDGQPLSRQYIRHPGAVVILPILERAGETRVLFVRNYRIAVRKDLLELPAGTLEAGEEPSTCAARELEEETGYSAATLEPLARFHTSPGLSDEEMWAFAARGLRFVGQRLEADEQLTVVECSPSEAWSMMLDGRLTDAKSMLTLLLAAERGVLSRPQTPR